MIADLIREADRFACDVCGSRASWRSGPEPRIEDRPLICAACFPESPDALCFHCAHPVERYDAGGTPWCNACHAAWTDTREPLPGVLCPACQHGQTYTRGPIGQTWNCGACQQSYAWACYTTNRNPSFPDPKKTKEAPMPKSPTLTLSHSQLEQWEQCQLRWRFNKIDKLPQLPSEALILGTAFHAALEADGRSLVKLKDYELLAIFETTFQAELKTADSTGLITNDKRIAIRRKAQLMIAEYCKTVQPHFTPTAIEEDFTYKLSDDVAFRGRIDAITAASIVDWKSASKPWPAGAQHDKDQATAYLIAHPEQTRVSFAVFAPDGDSCSFQSLPTTRTEEQKAQYRLKVLAIADQIKAAKASGNYAANPGPLCGWCGYLGGCTAGETWLKMKGRVPAVPVLRPATTQTGTQEAEHAATEVTA